MAKVGSIEIDIDMDTKNLDKGISAIEKKLTSLEEKWDKTDLSTEQEEQYYDRLLQTLENLRRQKSEALGIDQQHYENIKQQASALAEVNNLSEAQAQKVADTGVTYQHLLNQLQETTMAYRQLEKNPFQSENLTGAMEETKKEILDIINQIEKLNGEKITIKGINDMPQQVQKANNELTKTDFKINGIIAKVGKWALAIFGVRSAYNFVRQSMSTLTQYNKKMAADVEYIRWALAMTLKPVIEKIIELAYRLLYYINYIAKAWFGVNLFANASAKAFKKATSGLKASNKEAKKLEKTLAGFDEMNILSDNRDKSSGLGGDSGFVSPSMDLAGKEFPIPKWVQWIADHKDLILTIAGILTGAIITGKLISWLSTVGGLLGGGKGILGSLTGISKLAKLGIIAGGIVVIAGEVKKWYEDTEELKKSLNEINEEAPKQVKKSIDGETDINKLLKMNNTHRKNANNLMGTSARVNAKVARSDKERLKTLENTVLSQDQSLNKMKDLYDKGKLNTEEQKLFGDEIYQSLQYLYDIEDEYEASGKSTEEIVKKQKEYKDLLYQINPELAKQKFEIETSTGWWKQLVEQADKEKGKLKEISLFKIGDKSFSIKVKSDTTEAFKSISNFVSTVKTKLGSALDKVFSNIGLGPLASKLANGFGNILGPVYGNTRETIDKLKSKFRNYFAAKGAIINMPGRGVPVMAGERGQEGIIPLTDQAQMEMLGQMIGKYININATINTNLDGRTIARKVEQIQNESNFALNR